ncbi:hypothetical protein F4824DRAFT_289271 [Ustulina deusta]|nr:hypothetical protein F4824DRAFT_289271 [Ustulina deusta]
MPANTGKRGERDLPASLRPFGRRRSRRRRRRQGTCENCMSADCQINPILAYLDRGTACLPYAGKRLRPACCIGKGDRLVFSMRPQLLSSRNFLVPSRQDAKGPADYWRVLEQPRWRISWARSMITEVSTGIRYICRFDRIVGGYQGLSSRMAR